MDWPSPDLIERSRRRRTAVTFVVLALVSLVAATALVYGFDVLSSNAVLAQLASEGPLYADGCVDCDPGFRLPLPDWRSLSIWALAMAAAGCGWLARRG